MIEPVRCANLGFVKSEADMCDKERVSIELSKDVISALDNLCEELGLRSRGALVEKLLTELLIPEEEGRRA